MIPVSTEMALANPIMTRARAKPAFPTTHPSLKKSMIPRMVKTIGVKAPGKVPGVPFE
jgi:hypothetical protein